MSINLVPGVTAGLNQINFTDFTFRTFLPFPAGTLLEIVMGDSNYFGGSGGASSVYTVAPNKNSSNLGCAAELRRAGVFNTQTPLIVPSDPIAGFYNLEGAISEYPSQKKNNGAIIGGVIGGAVAVGLVIAGLVVFFFYRKRKQRKREELMWKEPKFVDAEDREGGRGWRRVEGGRLIESPTSSPGSGHRFSCLVSKTSSSRRGRA